MSFIVEIYSARRACGLKGISNLCYFIPTSTQENDLILNFQLRLLKPVLVLIN